MSSYTLSLILITVGLVRILWALWLWCDPDKIRQGPKWLRRLQARLLTWHSPRITPENELKLTDRQVRSYAKRSMLVGTIVITVGVLSLMMLNGGG